MKKIFIAILVAAFIGVGVTPAQAKYSDASHEMTGVSETHAAGHFGEGTTIAIIDQGVNLDHPDFQNRVIDGFCAYATAECPNGQREMSGIAAASQRKLNGQLISSEDHGNMVAGIAAGNPGNDSPGGVAPKANILMANTDLSGDSILAALRYIKSVAIKHNIVAVSMSFGGGVPISTRAWLICDNNPVIASMAEVLGELRDMGVIPFAASGNHPILDSDLSSFPSCLKDVVSVGSVNELGEISIYVTMSRKVSFLAPDFTRAAATVGYRTSSGTSAATPFVAGSYALLRAAFPKISPEGLLEILAKSGRPVDDVVVKGKPMVNLPAAFQLASGSSQNFVSCTNPKVTDVKPSIYRGETYLSFTIDPKCTGTVRVLLGSVRINNDLETAVQREINKKTTLKVKLPKSDDFLESKFYAVVTVNGVKIWDRDYLMDCKVRTNFVSRASSVERHRLTTTCPGVVTVTVGSKTVFSKVVSGSAIYSFSNPRNERVSIRFMNNVSIFWGGE
jgi:subtilisin family serine protease